MLVRGVPPSEIAGMLNIPRHTIYNDVRVIRSAKNDSLYSHTRSEIVAQLFLNARERTRYLWQTAENTDKDYVKVRATQELRLIDERILDRLSDPKLNPEREPEYSDDVIKDWIERYDELHERVKQLQERRQWMEERLRDMLLRGDFEGAMTWFDSFPAAPAG